MGWSMSAIIHKVWNKVPPKTVRSPNEVIAKAERLELELQNRVSPYAEDWDLVILANEIKRLRNML
jgi:hypothetical protein